MPMKKSKSAGGKVGKQKATKESVRLEALKVNMDKAVHEERYEDAAKIRDIINSMEHAGRKN